ncbi:MAG: DUF937 domain-containing protein [Blautia sp.]|nr:DUF937 domain-containing protein [Blautia sp.]
MNLLDMLMGSMTSEDSVNALSQKTGASSEQTSKLVAEALPVLMSAMTQNAASSKEGAEALLGALGQHKEQVPMGQQISAADEEDGAKILQHILGNNSGAVVNALAQDTQMDETQVNKSLANLAPALLSGLSAAAGSLSKPGVNLSDGLDFTDLMGMFLGGGQQQQSGTLGLLGSLFGGGQPQPQATSPTGLLGSLFGGGQQQASATSGLLGSLFGAPQPQQQSSGLGGLLGGLLGGGQQNVQSTSGFDGGDLLGILMNLMK